MTTSAHFTVDGYRLAADRYYDPETHLWVETAGGAVETAGDARCGFDPLGSETSGDVVALSFEPVGTRVGRGEAFGSLEAAKFVGPLLAPISGTIRAHNDAVLANPGLVNQDPLAHWLVALAPESAGEELPLLLHEPELVRAWFRGEIERFREKGAIAE